MVAARIVVVVVVVAAVAVGVVVVVVAVVAVEVVVVVVVAVAVEVVVAVVELVDTQREGQSQVVTEPPIVSSQCPTSEKRFDRWLDPVLVSNPQVMLLLVVAVVAGP